MHKVGTIWTWLNDEGEWITEIIWTDVMDDFDEEEQTDILQGVIDNVLAHFEDGYEEEEDWNDWF